MLSSFSCYTYSNKKIPRTSKKGKGKSCNRANLVSIVGPSFKNKNLIDALKGKELSKKHKQSLCLVWFLHNILWARDSNNNISIGLIKLFEDLEAFNSYPWGYESFKMTVQYLLTPLAPKTVNLYDFPWAFMVNYQEEVFCPRILRWLSGKTDYNTKFLDLFNPPKDAIVHLSLVLTNRELKMSFFLTLRAKHDVVINAINALTTFVKELTSKRGGIPSKRTLFSSTPLEIKAKRRRKVISKVLLSIQKNEIATHDLSAAIDESYVATDGSSVGNYIQVDVEHYATLLFLWKYREQKAQKPYVSDNKDP
ncbi:hypothetical protein BC332_08326 [Capsicum chinense]|nr:hypothetical protein BC332_08326 [Capsicum chinense]